MQWHFRGTPNYLRSQADRMGHTEIMADSAGKNTEIHRVSVLMAQLCEALLEGSKENGKPVFHPPELEQISATIGVARREVDKLYMLAAASEAMIQDACEAFELAPPTRPYLLIADADDAQTRELETNGVITHA